MFWKKNPAKELEKKYQRKMAEYRTWLEKGNRAKADMAYSEAEAVMSKLVDLKKTTGPGR
jgi:hypothetical protein